MPVLSSFMSIWPFLYLYKSLLSGSKVDSGSESLFFHEASGWSKSSVWALSAWKNTRTNFWPTTCSYVEGGKKFYLQVVSRSCQSVDNADRMTPFSSWNCNNLNPFQQFGGSMHAGALKDAVALTATPSVLVFFAHVVISLVNLNLWGFYEMNWRN